MWRYSTGRPRRLRTVFRRWPGIPVVSVHGDVGTEVERNAHPGTRDTRRVDRGRGGGIAPHSQLSRVRQSLPHDTRPGSAPCQLKLRLYAACVCSTLTHGSEAWTLTPSAMKALNGFTSRQLHRITGRPYRDEATHPAYDLLAAIRLRRHRWLGHILRMPPERLLHRAVRALGQRGGPPYHGRHTAHGPALPERHLSDSMGTRWPITSSPAGKPLGGDTLRIIIDIGDRRCEEVGTITKSSANRLV